MQSKLRERGEAQREKEREGGRGQLAQLTTGTTPQTPQPHLTSQSPSSRLHLDQSPPIPSPRSTAQSDLRPDLLLMGESSTARSGSASGRSGTSVGTHWLTHREHTGNSQRTYRGTHREYWELTGNTLETLWEHWELTGNSA